MLIKEIEDVLRLVKDLPKDWQLKCAKDLSVTVQQWEQRQSEPELSDYDWSKLQFRRRMLRLYGPEWVAEVDRKIEKILRDCNDLDS